MRQKNSNPKSRSHKNTCIFAEVNATALPQLEALCAVWLPGGRRYGAEYLALNPTREDRYIGSFSINVITGRWADFATQDRGGDPVSLYAYLSGLTQIEAAHKLAKEMGVAA